MTLKNIISKPIAYEVARITQGNNKLRVDATNRQTKERFSKWISKPYFNKLCKEWGRDLNINY